MKKAIYIVALTHLFFTSCAQDAKNQKTELAKAEETAVEVQPAEEFQAINPSGKTVETRFNLPSGFLREAASEGSYANYLRGLPLKEDGSEVQYYDGQYKSNFGVYEAVVDLEIGNKDLHQCADAVMRFRAEYLWNEKRYDEIHFDFTNGFKVDYSEWMKGKRMVVNGNKTYWINKANPSNTYQDFWNYMELIFNYAGTLSLSKELESVKLSDLQIGDVFIRGGSPGHAVLVTDVAEHKTTGEKLFLLAQSYMPAQETQILQNPKNSDLSPWYSISEIGETLVTPEWVFTVNELRRFQE